MVREVLESIVAEDVSVLEETILKVGGYHRQKVAVLRPEEMLMRQGQGFGTAAAEAAHKATAVHLPEPHMNTYKRTTAPTLYDLLTARLHLTQGPFTLFKSDVSKAHRRIKVQCRTYMIATIKDKF